MRHYVTGGRYDPTARQARMTSPVAGSASSPACCGLPVPLDHHPVRNGGILDDDHNAVANDEALGSWSASCTCRGSQSVRGAHAGVLSIMAWRIVLCAPTPSGRVRARGGPPLARRFVVVRAHHECLLDHTAGVDAERGPMTSASPYFLQNTALAQHGLAHVGVEQLRGGQIARAFDKSAPVHHRN